ncbi:MAG: SMP-30/gluconolactonase/LRE family protein [Anaerolineae bacterium]|nr:SMP-30/gluconolactonase/LRE family protein [Anaerolineae bacterium]MDW8172689.1 SMP-30/gluconolactonase/LRE family protein [Anaerolineae bacterium]
MSNFTLLDTRFHEIVDERETCQQLATGMAFTEGPVYLPDQDAVLFTDIPANAIMRWSATRGLSIYESNAHFAIGLYLDLQGRLIACEHSTRRLTRREADGSVTVLASHHGAHILNSTNDVCVRRDGAIFFTDPPFGVRQEDGQLHGYQQAMEYGCCGVFRVTDDPTAPQLVLRDIYRPNGLCFSPDERVLYVSDSSERHHCVYAYDMIDDQPTNGRVFAVLPRGVPDGMRVDERGRLYVAGLDGVYVYSPDGTHLGILHVPEMVTNLCFGGADRQTIYITAVSSLYAFRVKTRGVQRP